RGSSYKRVNGSIGHVKGQWLGLEPRARETFRHGTRLRATPRLSRARPRRRGDRMSAPAASWYEPAGASPAQVRGSVRLVVSVAWPLATVDAKRTQRLHGVWD